MEQKQSRMMKKAFFISGFIDLFQLQADDFIYLLISEFFSYDSLFFIQQIDYRRLVNVVQLPVIGTTGGYNRIMLSGGLINIYPVTQMMLTYKASPVIL